MRLALSQGHVRWRQLLLSSSVGAVSLGLALPAAAQQASAPGLAPGPAHQGGIEDITVTASRRVQNVQKTALAIQAVAGSNLRAAGVTQVTDLSKVVTGIQVGQAGSSSQVYIRGVGDFSANPLANPGVAFNVDEVYVARPEAVSPTFFDVSRIEVLKGPQGTLYGRNTAGGAINLITNSPVLGSTAGGAYVEIGNYDLVHVQLAQNLPISDTVAVRLALNEIYRNGYLSDGSDDDKEQGGRAKLLYKPTNDLTLRLNADAEHLYGEGGGYVYLPRAPGASAWDALSSGVNNAYLASLNPAVLPQGRGAQDNSYYNVNAQLDWNLGFGTLTIIPAFRHEDTYNVSYNVERQTLTERSDQESLEARLGGATANLKWVAGLYFFNEVNPGRIQILISPDILHSDIPYLPHGTSYAGFGEATYSVTDQLRIIAGGRYTVEQRHLSGTYNAYPASDPNQLEELEAFGGHVNFYSFTYKAGLEYDVAPTSLAYFTASTGFKSGGLTQTVAPINVYYPEKVFALEVGSKNRFFDNRLQVNLEGFYWKYRNQQNSFLTFDPLGNVNFLTENAGSADIEGFNLDVVARPTDNDTLHFISEYDDSHYTEFTYRVPDIFYNPVAPGCRAGAVSPGPVFPLQAIDCAGFPLAHSPKWTGIIDLDHRFDFSSGATFDVDANVRMATKAYVAVDFTPAEQAPGFEMLNFNLTYRPPSQRWTLVAYAHNVTDAREYTGGQESQNAAPLFAANINPPRTYGAQLTYTW